MTEDGRLRSAAERYEQAVFGGDHDAIDAGLAELDHVEADVALARGRLLHAQFLADRVEDGHELELFERATRLFAAAGDLRGEGEALFWIGIFHQVVRGDSGAALPYLSRSYDIATEVGDRLTQSYAVRHLGFVDLAGGDSARARERLEESVALRRAIGFQPGVAAGLLALAELAAEEGRPDDALVLLQEAADVANASGAAGIQRWIAEATAAASTKD